METDLIDKLLYLFDSGYCFKDIIDALCIISAIREKQTKFEGLKSYYDRINRELSEISSKL